VSRLVRARGIVIIIAKPGNRFLKMFLAERRMFILAFLSADYTLHVKHVVLLSLPV
jgi:hypothetical protein